MSSGLLITLYLVAALIAGIAGTIAARKRNRSGGFWMAATFLFPPLFFVLLALPVSTRAPIEPGHLEDSDDTDEF